ncbi:MAG: hypothetical protein A2915_00015 [Candidatus Yanofskybacteria bacterium RIFCSPLOWO2_01_FULL_41_34]|nr:MAG: hypothetical protein A2915_00015 [Candidatus Yanofskybacteria bacterium RIFCSPLOWO2_01_FULL_41_34]
MKKLMTVAAIVAVVVGSGAFYGGMKYVQGRGGRGNFTNLTPEQRQQFTANAGAGFRGGAGQGRAGMGGGFTVGEIISKDDKSITIKMPDGGSKIVFYSESTEVTKFTDGNSGDLIVGKTVSVNGSSNQDGSVTAQSIQLRPNLPTPTPKQ